MYWFSVYFPVLTVVEALEFESDERIGLLADATLLDAHGRELLTAKSAVNANRKAVANRRVW
jgi:hypothetical protein